VTLLGDGGFVRFLRFYRLCRRLRPDAAIFHFFHIEHVVLALAARLAGVSSITGIAGNPAPTPEERNSRKWRIIIVLSKIARCRIVSASAYIQASLLRLWNLPEGSSVIHNGCDCHKISSRAEKAKSSKPPVFTVGMISRLDPIKDHTCLLEAFAGIVRSHPQAAIRLRIIGDGELRDELVAKAETLSISDKVEFLGNRSDIPEQLGELDLFVLSTTPKEGFGIVLIEALAARVPIVASDVPACREVLRGGEFGRLVPPGDPQALAEAIADHLSEGSPLRRPPRPRREDVEAAYGLAAIATKHWRVLMNESVG
jgi:glycosyltransferase involved in cell wall biosynthesis